MSCVVEIYNIKLKIANVIRNKHDQSSWKLSFVSVSRLAENYVNLNMASVVENYYLNLSLTRVTENYHFYDTQVIKI